MRTETELNRIASEIIAGGIAVHRVIGPGCFESAYAPCLAYEFHKRGLAYRMKVPIEIRYEGLIIPRAYEADFIVAGESSTAFQTVRHHSMLESPTDAKELEDEAAT